jgi:hypothetical protein
LRNFQIEPRLLQAGAGRQARPDKLAVHMNCARAALRDATAELGAGNTNPWNF